jgi:acyl-CoA synthetase (AMP-forming)/AMP-acid ligase II
MIEDVLFHPHPAIAAAAAIGVPDESWGETVPSSVTNGRGGVFRGAAWR